MADTSRGQLGFLAETTATGSVETAPDFQLLRFTGSSLSYTKNTQESNEIDSSAMVSDLIEVGAESGGSIDVEWSPVSYDELIEAALRGTRSTAVNVAAGAAQITATSGLVTATSATPFTNASVGQFLLFSGWTNAGNNGWKEVLTQSATGITIPTTGLVNEDTTGGMIDGQTIINGTTERSFSFEEGYTDVDIYRLFEGQYVGTLTFDFAAGSVLTGSIGLQGMTVTATGAATPSWFTATGSSRVTASTTSVLNATANVGGVYIDGTLSTACFKSISINLDNGLRSTQCIGSKYTSDIGYGRQRVTGSLTKVFNSITLYQAMLDDSTISLAVGAYNTDGGIHVYLPKVKLGADNVNLSGGNDSDVDESIDFTALKNAAGTYQIRVDVADLS